MPKRRRHAPAAKPALLDASAVGTGASRTSAESHPYVGVCMTEDRHIRHELLATGRFDEARGTRLSAYQGRYLITGEHIDYVDDTGFTADGDFRDGVLYHAGMVLFRRS
jgi:hypothetical protein